MFEEKRARELEYGYTDMDAIPGQSFKLPNPYLINLLGKNKNKGKALLDEFVDAKKSLVVKTRTQSADLLPEDITNTVVQRAIRMMKPEYHDEIFTYRDRLREAATFGIKLGKLDQKEIGKRPVRVANHYLDAAKLFYEDVDGAVGACLYFCVYFGLFDARAGLI